MTDFNTGLTNSLEFKTVLKSIRLACFMRWTVGFPLVLVLTSSGFLIKKLTRNDVAVIKRWIRRCLPASGLRCYISVGIRFRCFKREHVAGTCFKRSVINVHSSFKEKKSTGRNFPCPFRHAPKTVQPTVHWISYWVSFPEAQRSGLHFFEIYTVC